VCQERKSAEALDHTRVTYRCGVAGGKENLGFGQTFLQESFASEYS
jgi:hypothetical protein